MACHRQDIWIAIFWCFMLTLCCIPTLSYAGNNFWYVECNSTANFTAGSAIERNLDQLLSNLLYNISYSANPFYNTSIVGKGSDRLYGLVQCRGDTSPDLCVDCVRKAIRDIRSNCGKYLGAKLWYEQCYLRWENSKFYGQLDYTSGETKFQGYVSDRDPFMKVVKELFNSLVINATGSPSSRYAFGFTNYSSESEQIYAIVQCWMDISMADCNICLQATLNNLYKGYYGNIGAGRLTASCMTGYDVYQLYSGTPSVASPIVLADNSISPSNDVLQQPSPDRKSSSNKLAAILGATGGSLLILLLLFISCYLANRMKTPAINPEPSGNAGVPEKIVSDFLGNGQPVIFSLDELNAATNNFDETLKLGEGGFGAVYKGTLANDEVVAVKKLVQSVRLKEEEFVNEVKLLANVQHRNLVNFLGWCTENANRILVFEYLPGLSLDKHLFDTSKAIHLDWKTRYRIITGIARGLVYLHEDSKVRIIHRDIKANNILLDENYNPKISDFGTARLFQDNESRVQTKVAGTCGYLAPEYAVTGQLTTKADVYSFGVLLLEIISGKNMRNFDPPGALQSLVEWTWRLYQEEDITVMVDQIIKDAGIMKQIERCIQIALLCTQADSPMRPSMSAVMLMLSTPFVPLPTPTRPSYVITQINTRPSYVITQINTDTSSIEGR